MSGARSLITCGVGSNPGGDLILIVPMERAPDACRSILSAEFRDEAMYRLTELGSAQYKQVAVLGVRRTRLDRDKLTDQAVQQSALKLGELIDAVKRSAAPRRSGSAIRGS